MKAEEYNLDFTVTLTAEDSKFTDEAVAAGVPLIVVTMFRDALRKLVASEREACAKACEEYAHKYAKDDDDSKAQAWMMLQCAAAIRARGQHD